GPDFAFAGDAGAARTLAEARGLIAQYFIGIDVNQKRRKSGEIGVRRRRERVARISVAEIVVRRSRDIEPVEHSAAVAVGSNGVARSGKIGPRRKERSRRWKRFTRTAKSDHERECQPTSCRFARHDDALRRITGAQKCPIE